MISKEEFDGYLDGKSIVVIGNAQSLFEQKDGEYKFDKDFIDSHDVVIRFNGGHTKLFGRVIGKKTNVWVTNRENIVNYSLFKNTNYIFFPYPFKDHLLNYRYYDSEKMSSLLYVQPFLSYLKIARLFNPDHKILGEGDRETIKAIEKKDKNLIRQTSGATTIHYILDNINYRSLSIVGFDFLKTKTFYAVKKSTMGRHRPKMEKEFITNLLENARDINWVR